MCPFENNTKRGSVKDSYIALILMAPQQTPLQQVEPGSPAAQPEEEVMQQNRTEERSGGPALEERISEIISTLNSLTAELSEISRARHSASEVMTGSSGGARRVETAAAGAEGAAGAAGAGGSGEPASFSRNRVTSPAVRLNVGGKVFQASWQLLLQVPDSRLGRIAQCRDDTELQAYCDNYSPQNNELFFNIRYRNFIDILDFYRAGALHISSDCCPIAFVSDLHYWGLSVNQLSTCCLKKYVDTKEQLDWEALPQEEVKEEEFKQGTPKLQRVMWNLFEHPHTSTAARVIGIISVSCIFLSTIILTLDTLPYFEDHVDTISGEFAPFFIIEAVYMIFFTIEFLVRVVCCPSKQEFMKKSMNWIDLLGIAQLPL